MNRTINTGSFVHRVHISDERHQVLFVCKNVVLLNESGYAYTAHLDTFWDNYGEVDG